MLAALAAALLLAAPAAASERHPTLPELEGELVCPTCKTTLDQSDAPVADQIRRFVRLRIRAGDTKGEIKSKLVVTYGPEVLAAPTRRGFDLIAWLLPLGGLAAGLVAASVLAWRWSRTRGGPVPAAGLLALDPALERRLDDELDRFE